MSAELYTERSEQTARMRMTHERRAAECNEHTARTRVARARMTSSGNANFSWFKLYYPYTTQGVSKRSKLTPCIYVILCILIVHKSG